MTRKKINKNSGKTNDSKRLKPDTSNEDSMDETPLNSTELPNTQYLKDLGVIANNLKTCLDPSLSDIINALGHVLSIQISTLKETSTTNEKITSIENKISSLKSEIGDIKKQQKEDVDSLKEKLVKTESNFLKVRTDLNVILQSKIDNDVVIAGFPNKPDEEYAIKEFCKFYDLPDDCISSYYSYMSKKKDGSDQGVLVVTFKTKTHQIAYREKKTVKGPITLNQVLETKVAPAQNIALSCFNRLTSLNQHIQRELGKLQTSNKIKAINYKNCQFYIRMDESSPQMPIASLEQLNDLLASLGIST